MRVTSSYALAFALAAPVAIDAQNAAVVLELPASARGLSLGGAMTAVGSDDAVIFYNPAQLATVSALAASLSLQRYLESTTLAALSAALRLGPGTVGLGIQSLSYGSVDVVVPDCVNFGCQRGEPTGATASASDLAATLGYAARIRGARLGGAAKVVRQGIAGESGTTGAIDVGASVDILKHVTIGAALQNLGGTIRVGGSSGPLPRTVRTGAALSVERAPFGVLVSADVAQVRDGDPRVMGGAELTWHPTPQVALIGRGGAAQRVAASDVRAATFGGALHVGHFAIDYGFQGFQALGSSSHRFGIGYGR
jgi:hypothetical protein